MQTKDEYVIVLTLTDGKLGEGNFIEQSLLLLVEDINDNVPIFKPHPTTITVREDSNPGILTTVEATDADEGAHGQVVYYVQELDGDNDVFSISTINGRGIIRLVSRLDYEKKYLYQLRVLAVDRAINEEVIITVVRTQLLCFPFCPSSINYYLWQTLLDIYKLHTFSCDQSYRTEY